MRLLTGKEWQGKAFVGCGAGTVLNGSRFGTNLACFRVIFRYHYLAA